MMIKLFVSGLTITSLCLGGQLCQQKLQQHHQQCEHYIDQNDDGICDHKEENQVHTQQHYFENKQMKQSGEGQGNCHQHHQCK